MNAMTLSQYARNEFFNALSAYREALTRGTAADLVAASLRVHAAKGGVPRRLRSQVGRVWKEVMASKQAAAVSGTA